MSITAQDSAVIVKTRELCAQIAGDPVFLRLQESVELFLNDDEARLQYQSVHQRGEELHHKQHAGIELGETEVREWEEARAGLIENDLVRSFLEARNQLESVQRSIGRYIGMTMELGRLPTVDELAVQEGGCCGGHGGCGCEH